MSAEAVPSGSDLGAQSLVQLTVARLRLDILGGAFAPGERLVEEQLTRRFGTSRAPLREALRLLSEQGLVEHLPRRGVRVVELSDRDVDELFGLREALERFALRSALTAPVEADRLAALERALVRIEVAATRAEHDAEAVLDRAEAHRAFHLALVRLAGHRHLVRAYEPILLQLQLCMATNMRREAERHSADQGARRHRALYEAVASGDLTAALDGLAHHGARTYLTGTGDGA